MFSDHHSRAVADARRPLAAEGAALFRPTRAQISRVMAPALPLPVRGEGRTGPNAGRISAKPNPRSRTQRRREIRHIPGVSNNRCHRSERWREGVAVLLLQNPPSAAAKPARSKGSRARLLQIRCRNSKPAPEQGKKQPVVPRNADRSSKPITVSPNRRPAAFSPGDRRRSAFPAIRAAPAAAPCSGHRTGPGRGPRAFP